MTFRNQSSVRVFFTILLVSSISRASTQNIHDFILQITRANEPGLAAVVIKDSEIYFEEQSGIASMASGQVINENTLFQLASSSKQFTGMAIALLEKDGLLKTTEKISKFFPMLPKFYQTIEVSDLIHHVSGLPEYFSESSICFSKKKATNKDVLQFLRKAKGLHFVPKSQFEYNNTNYVLLALIVEKISQKSFGKFLESRIFKPLGMNRSSTVTQLPKGTSNIAESYQTLDQQQVGYAPTSCDSIEGDGGVFSTAHDLKKWFHAISKGTLLDQSILENKIFQPIKSSTGEEVSYGYGWFLTSDELGRRIIHHGGGWLGFHHSIVYSPSENIWLLVLANHLDYGPPARDAIAESILEMVRQNIK